MKAKITHDKNMRFIGENEEGHKTYFDSDNADYSAATPMQVMLQSAAACSAMDVISILQKKRKTVDSFSIEIDGEKGDEHPKMFKKVKFIYTIVSPDAEQKDLDRSIELSMTKYCGASATLKAAGADFTTEGIIKRP